MNKIIRQAPSLPLEDWRASYGPGLPWWLTRPCGAWFRACASVSSPRQRLLTMVSCRPANAA